MLNEINSKIVESIENLRNDTNAKAILLLDRSGQRLVMSGRIDDDYEKIKEALVDSMPDLLSKKEAILLNIAESELNSHLSIQSERVLQIVTFNDSNSSESLVRLSVKKAASGLKTLLDTHHTHDLEKITDDDIFSMFS